jgi:hypothetical protein
LPLLMLIFDADYFRFSISLIAIFILDGAPARGAMRAGAAQAMPIIGAVFFDAIAITPFSFRRFSFAIFFTPRHDAMMMILMPILFSAADAAARHATDAFRHSPSPLLPLPPCHYFHY